MSEFTVDVVAGFLFTLMAILCTCFAAQWYAACRRENAFKLEKAHVELQLQHVRSVLRDCQESHANYRKSTDNQCSALEQQAVELVNRNAELSQKLLVSQDRIADLAGKLRKINQCSSLDGDFSSDSVSLITCELKESPE